MPQTERRKKEKKARPKSRRKRDKVSGVLMKPIGCGLIVFEADN